MTKTIDNIVKRVKGQREPTPRHKKLAGLVVENSRNLTETTKQGLLLKAGYPENTAKQPSVVLESKGFQLALAELGLTKELVVNALQEDIKAKPQRRAFELSIAGKWLGLEQKGEAPTTGTTIQNSIIIIQPPNQAKE